MMTLFSNPLPQAIRAEVETKLARVREKMVENKLDAVQIRLTPNMAWLTGGAATYVGIASDTGPASLFITPDKAYIFADTIETPRLRHELLLETLGFEFVTEVWHSRGSLTKPLMANRRIGFDNAGDAADGNGPNLDSTFRAVRRTLMTSEVERARFAGRVTAEALNEAIRAVRPGDSEVAIAGRLAAAVYARGGLPIVNLVASDERVFQYRHPLPTSKAVEKYAMLAVCVRYGGLVISASRLIHFGPLPNDLRAKAEACARVDARLILNSRVGRTLGDLFAIARETYQSEGYPEAIDEHHQGGLAGYVPREIQARPGDITPIAAHQLFAWNPSIRGVKSEDTILITPKGPEVLTTIENWPMQAVAVDEGHLERPLILVVDA